MILVGVGAIAVAIVLTISTILMAVGSSAHRIGIP
jgi:hypothetical protein